MEAAGFICILQLVIFVLIFVLIIFILFILNFKLLQCIVSFFILFLSIGVFLLVGFIRCFSSTIARVGYSQGILHIMWHCKCAPMQLWDHCSWAVEGRSHKKTHGHAHLQLAAPNT